MKRLNKEKVDVVATAEDINFENKYYLALQYFLFFRNFWRILSTFIAHFLLHLLKLNKLICGQNCFKFSSHLSS